MLDFNTINWIQRNERRLIHAKLLETKGEIEVPKGLLGPLNRGPVIREIDFNKRNRIT